MASEVRIVLKQLAGEQATVLHLSCLLKFVPDSSPYASLCSSNYMSFMLVLLDGKIRWVQFKMFSLQMPLPEAFWTNTWRSNDRLIFVWEFPCLLRFIELILMHSIQEKAGSAWSLCSSRHTDAVTNQRRR